MWNERKFREEVRHFLFSFLMKTKMNWRAWVDIARVNWYFCLIDWVFPLRFKPHQFERKCRSQAKMKRISGTRVAFWAIVAAEQSLEIAKLSLFPYTGTYEYVRKRNDICEVITFRFRRFMVSLPQLISFPLSVRATLPNEMGAKKFLGFTVIRDRLIHTDLAR